MEQSSQNPLAVVTGASRGIGLALAQEFARHGFDLIVASESSDIHTVKEKIGNAFVETVQVDLASYQGVENFYRRIQALGRPVSLLALNAGVGLSGEFKTTDLRDELRLINLNVVSVVHLCKLVLSDMLREGEGQILFTSSVAATAPAPYLSVYAASKAFVQSFAEAIRHELKDTGVSVTSLMPGATDTDFFARAGMEDTKVAQNKKDAPEDVARDAWKAIEGGDDAVVAGSFKNALQTFMGRFISEPMKAKMQARETKPQGLSPEGHH